MLNYIWLGLLVAAVVIGGCTGSLKAVTDQSFAMAKFAVLDTALPLVGIMALWLGLMRLAERAGLVTLLARALRPLMRRLFPDVPAEHPAMGSMLLNLAANMLGLGNAATPLGLRAMEDLERRNPRPGTATNAMCTFLAINTSSVQLIPVTAIAILAANQSSNPTAIVGTAFFATLLAACSGVAMAKLLEKLPWFRLAQAPAATDATPQAAASGEYASESRLQAAPGSRERGTLTGPAAAVGPMRWWGGLLLAVFGLFFLGLFVKLAFPSLLGATLPPETASRGAFVRVVDAISKLSIPFLLAFFPLYAALRGVKVYEEFVEGAKEGFTVAVKIIPYLVAILVAIGMFRAAGGIALLSKLLGPVMRAVGFPPDLLPLALMRPLSGSGALGVFAELVKQFGPDSLISRTAGTIYGSTETTFYVLAVYFGAVSVKRTRHAVLAGLTADVVGVIASVIICKWVFGR